MLQDTAVKNVLIKEYDEMTLNSYPLLLFFLVVFNPVHVFQQVPVSLFYLSLFFCFVSYLVPVSNMVLVIFYC